MTFEDFIVNCIESCILIVAFAVFVRWAFVSQVKSHVDIVKDTCEMVIGWLGLIIMPVLMVLWVWT